MPSEFASTVAELKNSFRAMQDAHQGDLKQNEREIVRLRPQILRSMDTLETSAKLPGSGLSEAQIEEVHQRVAERRAAYLDNQRRWGIGRMHENQSGYLQEMQGLAKKNAEFMRWLQETAK